MMEDPAAHERLRHIWRHIESGAPGEHTSVIVPSLSFDREELAKIQGIQFYEERLLLALLRLRDPRARVVYVTSQPIPRDVVLYYLELLPASSRWDAGRRLEMVSAHDASPRSLTEKILERPRLLQRMRRLIEDSDRAYLTCFNTTALEGRLAAELGIPLNGTDPELAWIGTKSGSRRIFEEAGVACGFGHAGVRTRGDVVKGLEAMRNEVPGVRGAVVKLDDSFAGAGNAVYRFPDTLPTQAAARRRALDAALDGLDPASGEAPADFFEKLERMGGVVEEFIESPDGGPIASPSVQLRIDPEGAVHVLSTHDQVLGGPIGQTYVGCRFPAGDDHRSTIRGEALRVADVLARKGVVGRFGIDFLVTPDSAGGVRSHAVEINLRMGGTTFPFMALTSLVTGVMEPDSGVFRSSSGSAAHYFATDNLRSSRYAGLCPEDFLEILLRRRLLFDPTSQTGPVFHMIGALSEFGRVGVTCIGDDRHPADAIYRAVVDALDAECPSEAALSPAPTHPMGLPISRME